MGSQPGKTSGPGRRLLPRFPRPGAVEAGIRTARFSWQGRGRGPAGKRIQAARGMKKKDGAIIVDSALDFQHAVEGTEAPRELLDSLCLIEVLYHGFDACRHLGQLVVHRAVAAELRELFALMERQRFPIAGVKPMVRFGWSDEASMAADNTSAFNYRLVAGTARLSRHALGRAVDINPVENPVIYPGGRIVPPGAVWQPGKPGTFTGDHPVVSAFRDKGWKWGGHFDHIRDYHHFEREER